MSPEFPQPCAISTRTLFAMLAAAEATLRCAMFRFLEGCMAHVDMGSEFSAAAGESGFQCRAVEGSKKPIERRWEVRFCPQPCTAVDP